MNKSYIFILMLLVLNFGGFEYAAGTESATPSGACSTHNDPKKLCIDKATFGDVFESLENKTSEYNELLGSPGSMSYYKRTIGGEGVYMITTDAGRDTTWETALFYGLLKNNKALIEKASARLDGSKGFDYTLIRVISNMGKFSDIDNTIGILMKKGASPDARGYAGNTPLHKLMSVFLEDEGRLKVMAIMIKAGANPNVRNDEGNTPLSVLLDEYTFIQDKGSIITVLAMSKLDLRQKDASGSTVFSSLLKMATMEEHNISEDTIIEIMHSSSLEDIEIDAPDKKGRTYLNIAYFGGFEKVTQELLAMGAKDYAIRIAPKAALAMNTTIIGLNSQDIVRLKGKQCQFILNEYAVKYENLSGYKGVDYPIKLKSKVGGIEYRHTASSEKFSVMDCRLAVALVAWSPVLKKHKVKEIEHMRAYSPGAKIGGGKKQSYHSRALALDPAYFIYEDGTRLVVKEDWTERDKGEGPCHALKVNDRKESKAQVMLRKLVCDTGRIDVFGVIITPHYNKAHHDHVHVELNPNESMFLQ